MVHSKEAPEFENGLPSYLETETSCSARTTNSWDECSKNYQDDLIEPWLAPIEYYFQTLSKQESADFSGISSLVYKLSS